MSAEKRLTELGIVLPAPLKLPPGVRLPFVPVRVVGRRAVISGHGPLDGEGNICGPFGKVGTDVSIEQATRSARLTFLAMLADLRLCIGSLDRVTAWVKLLGMVNAAPGFNEMPRVINGASDVLLEIFGPEIGAHSRSAVGVAELPWHIPVEIEAECEFA
ncbi:MAG: RidA family protein [Burkholderiales bacterium]|nr:RidA family protein [Burkholderiales bacterium]